MTVIKFYTILLVLTLAFNSFSIIDSDEQLIKSKIKFKSSKGLFAKRHTLTIDIPKQYKKKWDFETYHGLTAGIYYPNSSSIYYWDDNYIMTPNKDNYKTIGFELPVGWAISDTVIGGQQSNGRFWKEKFIKHYWIGYRDVPKEKVELFDKSLESFKRSW